MARSTSARERAMSGMKKLLFPGAVALLLALVLVACGKPAGSQGTTTPTGCNGKVEMATATFVQSSCTVKAGDPVQFVDPTGTGNLHILCLGDHQQCKANADGPAELNVSGGVQFNAGDTKSFTFAKAGTYIVTCTIHPGMDITITVQ
jgi:plastocyanin